MKLTPTILAIETALANGSLSLLKADGEVDSYIGRENSLRSSNLLQIIIELLEKNDLKLSDLDLIAVSTGPGSFTGIRVELATAQALSFAQNCPVVGVSVLEAMAFSLSTKGEIISVVSGGRNQLFWQKRQASEYQESCLISIEDFFAKLERVESSDVAVIAERKLQPILKDLQTCDNRVVKFASDNVAQLIGLFSLNLLKTENPHTLLRYPPFPNYILEAEINRQK